MICMSFLILAVYAIGFVCALDTLDGSLRNFILFAEFRNLTGKHCTAVCQFRRGILTAHAGDELGALVQLSLGIVLCVVQCLGKGIVFGLVRVGCVFKDALQAVLDRPNLSYLQ